MRLIPAFVSVLLLASCAAEAPPAAANPAAAPAVQEALAKADADIRAGLRELAKQYPQLSRSPDWKWISTQTSAREGILVAFERGEKIGKRVKSDRPVVLEQEEFRVRVWVRGRPSGVEQAGIIPSLYPQLGLFGGIDLRAADPELAKALNDLVSQALLPLKRLDDAAAPAENEGRPVR